MLGAMSTRLDISGRVTGLLVFLAGIGLLVFVFSLAHALFNTPTPPLPAPAPVVPGSQPAPSAAIEIGRDFSVFTQRVLLLFLMCIAGSLIASKGIQLYFAARGPGEMVPERVQQPVAAQAPLPETAPPAPVEKRPPPVS